MWTSQEPTPWPTMLYWCPQGQQNHQRDEVVVEAQLLHVCWIVCMLGCLHVGFAAVVLINAVANILSSTEMVAAAALGAPAASVLDFGGTSQIVTSSGQALRARPQPTSTHATQPPTQATATSGGGRGGRGRGRGGRGAGRAQVVVCDDSDSVEEDEDEDAVVEIRGNPRTTRNRRNNGNDAYMADAIDDDEDAPTPQRPRPRQSTAPRGRRGASPLALTATTPASARPPSIVLDDDEDDEEQASVIAPTPSGNARGSQPASARKRALPGIFGIRGGSSQAGGRTRA